MTLKYRILTVLVAGTFVAGFGLAESAYAAKKKKLTYEQAWDVCKKEMDKMGIFGTSTQANERHTRGAGCIKKYGYRIGPGRTDSYRILRPRVTPSDRGRRLFATRLLVNLSHEAPVFHWTLVVVAVLFNSLGQLDLVGVDLLVRNCRQNVRDAIQPCAPVVVGAHHVPRRVLAVRRVEHYVARLGVAVPVLVRFRVHRTQFPLTQWIVDAVQEALFLLLFADFQPELYENDTGVGDVLFDRRRQLEEPLVSLLAYKTHDVFNAGAVVPAAIEDHDFPGRRKLFDVALEKELGLLPFRGCGQGNDAKYSWAYSFSNCTNGAAFAGRIATL